LEQINTKLELILHPTRLRILTTLIDRQLTPQEMAEALVDIPAATLYRQLNKLLEGEMVRVVEERRVRGTVEKVYALNQHPPGLTPEDLQKASKDDLLQMFISFVLSAISDFGRYLQKTEKPDLIADRVSFNKAPVYFSDEELAEIQQALVPLLMKGLHNKPGEGRRFYLFNTIMIPGE
jgi:DNA-binding transcriptional ArsR family regulator